MNLPPIEQPTLSKKQALKQSVGISPMDFRIQFTLVQKQKMDQLINMLRKNNPGLEYEITLDGNGVTIKNPNPPQEK